MKALMMVFLVGVLCLSVGVPLAAEQEDRDDAEVRKEMQEARRELAEAARRVAELTHELGEGMAWHLRTSEARAPRRAMLGVNIGDSNKDGVEVLSVTPGGPADKAGLRTGDRITGINDIDLSQADRAESALVETLARLGPGDEVTVKYRRDGKQREAVVKTEAARHVFRFLNREDMPSMPSAPFPPGFHFMGGWADIELVSLSPELGEYFGTDKGLLVVRSPDSEALQLKDGDVIRAIGGREPQNAGHALRILRSYQPGEKVKIDIVRKQKKTTLEVEMPDRRVGVYELPEVRGFEVMLAPEAMRDSK